MKKNKPFNPKKNRVEYHAIEKANHRWKVVRLTIHPKGGYKSATVFKDGTHEEADHYQLLISRNR